MPQDEGPTIDMPSDDGSEQRPDAQGGGAGAGEAGGGGGKGDPTRPMPEGSGAKRVSEDLGGTQIGPYRVLSVLGEGGFGIVYLAEQLAPVRRRVALKVIKPGMDTRAVVARFEAERQALAVMDHPCIARVFDAGQTPNGRPYFVMEFVRGVPLTDFADRHQFGLEQRLRLFRRVCDAVQHAHNKGIIHRDLKPSNILVEYEEGEASPKIIDFGVAKAIDQRLTEKTIFTEQGQILGTPEYMSPEQAEMSGLDIDTRTDVYALGVVLYELLTGALPFDARSLRSAGYAEIQRIIREVDPPRPSTKLSTVGADRAASARPRVMDSRDLTRRLRRDLDWVVMKCLEKNRERRYATAAQLAAEIDRYLKLEPVEAGPPSVTYRLQKFVRRRRGVVAAASLVFASLAIGLTGTAIALGREAEARRAAEVEGAKATQLAGFLTGVLTGIDPEVAMGLDRTLVKRIFDSAADRVEDETEGEPEVEATIRGALGEAYNAVGLSAEAEAQLRRAIRLEGERLGAATPPVRALRRELAEALWDQARLDEALAAFEELAADTEEGSREWLAHRRDLGGVLALTDDTERAEEILTTTLAKQRAELGEGDADTLRTLVLLADLKRRTGDAQDAEDLARSAAQGRAKTFGEEHPLTIFAEFGVASSVMDAGRAAEAEGLLRGVVDKCQRVLGERHTTTLAAEQRLGVTLRRLGRAAEAAALLGPVVERRREVSGLRHVETYNALMGAGRAAQDAGEPLAALRYYTDAVVSADGNRVYPAFYLGYARASRGTVLSGLERYDEAETELLAARPSLAEALGEAHPLVRSVTETLAQVYERTGRQDEAALWRARASEQGAGG